MRISPARDIMLLMALLAMVGVPESSAYVPPASFQLADDPDDAKDKVVEPPKAKRRAKKVRSRRTGTGEPKIRVSRALMRRKGKGSIRGGEVIEVLKAHHRPIKRCYTARLRAKPKLAGKLNFSWTIITEGKVRNVRKLSSTINDSTLTSCISKVIAKMRFPSPKDGEVVIRIPWMFKAPS